MTYAPAFPTESPSVTEARQQRDAARKALSAAHEGLAAALLAQASYLDRIDKGLSSSASTMRDRADTVHHAELVIPPAERAVERSEVGYRVAVAEHVAAVVQNDDRLNGAGLVAARAAVAEHVNAALQLAEQFFADRNAGLAAAEELGTDADLPTATVSRGIGGARLVEVDDPLGVVWRLPRGLALQVPDGTPGTWWGVLAVEPAADVAAAARQLVVELTGTATTATASTTTAITVAA